MKKLITLLLVVIFVLTSFAGCQRNNTADNTQVNNIQESEENSVESMDIVDKTVKINSFDPCAFSTVEQKTSGCADYIKIYDSPEFLFTDATAVVYGTVKEINYWDESGMAYIIYSFLVEKSYKGNQQPGELISVTTPGGYLRLEKFIEKFGDAHFKDFSKEKIKNTVYKDNYMGTSWPKQGDKFMLFLYQPEIQDYPEIEGSYGELGDFMGRYYYNDQNQLMHFTPENEPDFYKAKQIKSLGAEAKNVFTFSEMDQLLTELAKQN